MAQLSRASFCSAVFLICLGVRAHGANDYIIAARRTGVIEFIDPATLKTLSSIRVNLALSSTGLNGVFADPDGRTIYIEGPIGANAAGANNCCWLYAIDLTTSQAKVVAGIWGTRSRRAFISAGPGLMQPVSSPAASAIEKPDGDRWQASPDGHWWAGLRNGPALDLYDVARGEIARSFAIAGGNESSWSSGTWLGNYFYVYATDHGSGRLWALTPESTQLGDGVPITGLGQVPGCSTDAITNITAAGGHLVIYEVFGSKIDRRERCKDVPGGAWIVDPATGQLPMQVASEFHFWMLMPNHAGSELYGVTSEIPNTQAPAELIRLDVHSGRVLQYRHLDGDYWWITTAPLRAAPTGDVSISLTADDAR
jgi:hypothetical protein